jgi:hypothetical protein
MVDQMNMLMVFCAAVAALALGVMLGYVCCKTLFDVLKFHARMSPAEGAEGKAQVARV